MFICLFRSFDMIKLLFLIFFLLALGSHHKAKANSIKVAITVDDLSGTGPEHPDLSRKDVLKGMIRTFQKHGIKDVYGFLNGITAKGRPENMALLYDWKRAGFKIGNHTFSHLGLSKTFFEDFVEDLEKNEPLLLDVCDNITELKVFRFPFLEEGDTKAKRKAIMDYLSSRNYRLAPVSVDYADWAWADAFVRCSKNHDQENIKKLKSSYLMASKDSLVAADKIARKLYGEQKEFKHILLIHAMAMTSSMLDDVLTEFKKNGVEFISLDEALKEPAYAIDTGYVHRDGINFLYQILEIRDLDWKGFSVPETPTKWLEGLCKPGNHH